MDDRELQTWLKRAEVVGKAQERYLLLLLVAGIFFLALDRSQPNRVVLPVLNLQMRPTIVWAAGPFVLSFLLIAAFGSLKAYGSIEEALQAADITIGESFDTAPNVLDFAFYTTKKSPRWMRKLFLFVYPTYFALFWIEAVYLLGAMSRPFPSALLPRVTWGISLAVLCLAAVRIVQHWARNVDKAKQLAE